MIRRILALLVLAWLLGLIWFAVTLPGPSTMAKTDGIVVLTGGAGRFQRGLDMLAKGRAERLLVSGVDPIVKRREFIEAQHVPPKLFHCCIDLDKEAFDTVTNAEEAAQWIRARKYKTIRLVTTDWHMPRARFEFTHVLGREVAIYTDGVPSHPGLIILVREYNKLLLRRISVLIWG